MSPVQVFSMTAAVVDLQEMISADALAELEPDEISAYMTYVNAVLDGREVYWPADAPVPFVLAEQWIENR